MVKNIWSYGFYLFDRPVLSNGPASRRDGPKNHVQGAYFEANKEHVLKLCYSLSTILFVDGWLDFGAAESGVV